MLTVILISYLVIMFGVSVWANKFNSSTEDFLLAGRRLGVFLAAFTLAATYFGGGYVVGLGAEAYSSGMIAWYNGLAGAVGILAVCLVLKKMEGMQLYTVAEILETRYGSPLLRFLCAMLSLLALVGILAGQVNSAGSILSSIGIGSPVVGGLIAAAFFIGYTVVGGLWAVTITDFIQIIVAGAGIIAATFFTIHHLGGWGGLVDAVNAQTTTNYFTMTQGVEPSYILYLILPMFIYTLIGQDVYQRLFAAKDTNTAKKAGIMACVIVGILTFFPVLLGIAGKALFPELANPSLVVPQIISTILPPALGGITLAAVIAAILSTADSILTAATSHVIGDVYLRFILKGEAADDAKLLKMSRLWTLIIGLISVFVALMLPNILNLLLLSYTIYTAGVFAPVVGGLLWKKATKEGAFAGLAGGLLFVVLGMNGFSVFGVPSDIMSCFFSVIIFVIVSLFTCRPGKTGTAAAEK